MLAIQFSKTERCPSSREATLEPSLERRGSREDNRSLQGGRLLHQPSRCRQEEFERLRSDRLSTRGRGCLHPLAPPVKPSWRLVPLRREGTLLLSPRRVPVKPCRTASFGAEPEGPASTPRLGIPSRKNPGTPTTSSRLLPPGGRVFYRSLRAPSSAPPRLAASRRPGRLALGDALSTRPPPRCQPEDGRAPGRLRGRGGAENKSP